MLKQISILIFLLFFVSAASANSKPKVLYIESYHDGYAWDQEQRAGLESILKDQVELYNFQMDTKRIDASQYQEKADLAWKYYLEVKPDIVVLSDDNALMFLEQRFLKTDTPVVYMGINNNPRNYGPLGENVTGVLERPLYKRTIRYLKEFILFNSKKVLILLDKGTTSEVFRASVFHDQQRMEISGIKADVNSFYDYSNWRKAVMNARENGYEAIVIGLYHSLFEGGANVDGEEVLAWTSANSPVPVFAFWEMSVGKGKAVGGMVLSGKVQGRAAGEIVMKIIGGTPVSSISPVIPAQGEFVFSQSELDRWKIRLPLYIKNQARMRE
ncbi:ABC transporter substrate-binding protein [Maridesulfovibrio salexigens]|uniref:ABC-type sugar transport system, ATPase component n=1 Tax=Maridesulfovibrio salexigens (strain ATCC 14822 / DSM 2638 / NCIMB 8403 / VKM B-1763) TaxID=526222 RepID=C6BWU0_MARSD|nr:ABC transporter substrate binding protein [Maridesulfovibrio salexigens]ACS80370.1 ABC-type sugar transport system, ATPase component [Maridesulfovibrio salexigens DSM 2638]